MNPKDRFDILLDPEKHGYKQCPHCNGYGSSLKDPEHVDVCTLCHGPGVIKDKNPFEIFEYDSVKRKKLTLVGTAMAIKAARKKAVEVAIQWCEEEKPGFFNFGKLTDVNGHYEICIGHSDFGALIEFDRNEIVNIK